MNFFDALLSHLVGLLARCTRPRWLVRLLIRSFCRIYAVDTAELPQPISSYSSLLSFFIRQPTAGARPIHPDPSLIISPVDAEISSLGTADNATLLLVKGHHTSLTELIGAPLLGYLNATFLSLYLSPRDIHRIYAPCDAHVARAWSISGSLYSVSPSASRRRPYVFCHNRRVITELAAPWGTFLLVKIGARNVGRIVVNHPVGPQPSPPISYRKGEELGRFELGSTIILIFPSASVSLLPQLHEGDRVRIGQPIARILALSPP